MKMTYAIVTGLALMVASCAPVAAPSQPAETPPSTVSSTVPREAQKPATTSQTLAEEEATAPALGDRSFQPQLKEISIDTNEVVTLLPRDAIPAVLPERAGDIMVSAVEADGAGIDPGVQVIGLEINGESQAYPIPFLSAHEIVNTTVGGRPIAVTW